MLESGQDQGATLRRSAPSAAPRVMAMVRHGDPLSELPLLWQLCAALQTAGYPVAVLDGSSAESEDSPGLQHWLDGSHWPFDVPEGGPAWPVFPAASGLAALRYGRFAQHQVLRLVGALLKDYAAIVVFAPVAQVADLLAGSAATPLIAISPVATTVLTGYGALKALSAAGLKPALAAQSELPGAAGAAALAPVRRTLQHCARTYLGEEPDVLSIHVSAHDERPSDDLQRLALHLLENALPICQDAGAPAVRCATASEESGVVDVHRQRPA